MALDFSKYSLLLLFVTLFVSCGGGGGGKQPANEVAVSSTASNSSLSASSASSLGFIVNVPMVIGPENQTHSLDEDVPLKGEIKADLDFVSALATDFIHSVQTIKTVSGGVVQLVSKLESGKDKNYFTYTPPEDFNGEDSCQVLLIAYTLHGEQTITLHFNVRPVADPYKVQIASKVYATGERVQFAFPYNPDTKDVVTQDTAFTLSFGGVAINHKVDSTGINFVVPENILAGVNSLNINFEYQGKVHEISTPVLTKKVYGDVEYWLGDKDRSGVTYVAIAEKDASLQRHLGWAETVFPRLLKEPLISQYSDYWNIAVIKKLAPENYAYIYDEKRERIIAASLRGSGEEFIKSYVPRYDWVILNTVLEGRATGGYPLVLQYDGIGVLLHELGHTHAKLADEYAEPGYISNAYLEGSSPNISNYNSYDLIPWHHWILDRDKIPGVFPVDDPLAVGAFLGGYYTDNQYYRPMRNSKMRDVTEPFSPVDSEAWILSTYEHLGILGSATHNKKDNVRTFTLAKSWSKNLTRIDWFVDDVKQDAWVNQSSVMLDETKITGNHYEVKVELTDLSGYVKNPHAYPAFNAYNGVTNNALINMNFRKSWAFDKTLSEGKLLSKKSSDEMDVQSVEQGVAGDDWLVHSIVIENGAHQLRASSRYHQQDTLLQVTAHSELRADVIDARGVRLYSIGIDRPYVYYHGDTGLNVLTDKGGYQIRHPHIAGAYQIDIVNVRTNQLVKTFNLKG